MTTAGGSGLSQEEHDQLMALPDEDEIADQVWDETHADHLTVGSTGESLSHLDVDVSSVASGVWGYSDRSLTQSVTVSGGGLTQEEHDHLLALDTSGIPALQTSIEDALGLAGENTVWSGMAFDSNNYLISAVITHYTDNTLAVEREKWQLTASYDAQGRITSYQFKEY